MKLDEMQILWQQLEQEGNQKQALTDNNIKDMIQERYSNRFSSMATYESIGAGICFLMGILIFAFFNRLDTWYLMLCGAITIAYLFVLPGLVLSALYKIRSIELSTSNYQSTLLNFKRAKDQLLLIQRTGIYLNFILMLTILPVFAKIMKGKDLFINNNAWWWYLPIMFLFLFFFSRWGYRCYKSVTRSAEAILNELE